MEVAAIGFASNIVQLTGLNPIQLISMIWNSAQYARVHKRNCIQFAENLQRIANLLDPIKESKYLQAEALQEPLSKLKEQLFFGFILVDNCKNKSKFIVFAFSWYKQVPKKFQDMENEIRELVLTCVPLINTHLQINAQNDMGNKLQQIHEEIRKIQKGTYKESREEGIQAVLAGDESVIFQREHARLQEGYMKEKRRLEKMLQQRRESRHPLIPAQPAPNPERVHLPPDQNPLTENWHLYALKYSNEYRYRHAQQLCQSSPSHLSHSNSLPPKAAPRQYFHSLSVNYTTHRGLHNGPTGLPNGPSSWQPRSLQPDLSESILSEVYCAVGYSYKTDF